MARVPARNTASRPASGRALRVHQRDLGRLVTLETGKILTEGEGEVQEMIDMCGLATGLSRQLHGLTIASERPGHRLMEQWHPLGVVGIISAFNFPVAVWAWNSALATVCGDATVWKPSEKTPLTALACVKLAERVCRECGVDPAIFSLACGDGAAVGEPLVADHRITLVSATGSTRMGRRVAEVVAKRLGRSLLELGGNNAVLVTPSADLKLAARAILFGAMGTAGQRCTTTRRLIAHESIVTKLTRMLEEAWGQVRIGNPLDPATLMGPLIDYSAVEAYGSAIDAAKKHGGRVLAGGKRLAGAAFANGHYVTPCLIEAENAWSVVQHETFAPVLYDDVSHDRRGDRVAERRAAGTDLGHFTNDVREAELFLSARGSGAASRTSTSARAAPRIGGALRRRKETGGGRESGSDAWKKHAPPDQHGELFKELPLAQDRVWRRLNLRRWRNLPIAG